MYRKKSIPAICSAETNYICKSSHHPMVAFLFEGGSLRLLISPPCCGTRRVSSSRMTSSLVDRCHSLRSLHPPPAALPSLPVCGTRRMSLARTPSSLADRGTRLCSASPATGSGRLVLLLRCPTNVLGDGAPSSLVDRGHSLGSLASATGGGRLVPQIFTGFASSNGYQQQKNQPSRLG